MHIDLRAFSLHLTRILLAVTPLLANAHHLLGLIEKAGFEARLVGGVVRDLLAGRAIEEADLACTATPQEAAGILEKAGLKVVPTGLAYGTITAVCEGVGFEITSLREDIETDGRHARVTYTKDWQKDAARRDFTFNAMSQDRQGCIYDYYGGAEDLRRGRVVFVGDAPARLKEDYLRLLRFFRFYAFFGRVLPDDATQAALKDAAPHLARLSRERVWKELKRLLSAPDPTPALAMMDALGIMGMVLPGARRAECLAALLETERKAGLVKSGGLLRLAHLLFSSGTAPSSLQERFALSEAERVKLQQFFSLPFAENPPFAACRTDKERPLSLAATLHFYGLDLTREFLALAGANGILFDWDSIAPMLENWQPKIFPLKGADIVAAGISPGPSVGAVLRETEAWWIERSFQPDRDSCLCFALTRLAR